MGGMVTVMGQTHHAEHPAPTKKTAEHSAAKAAMQALYPSEFKECLSTAHKASSAGKGVVGMVTGQKRKRDAEHEEDPKSKLVNSAQLLIMRDLGRCIAKHDIEWFVEEFNKEQTMYQCSVTITHLDGGKTFSGEMC